MYWLQSPLDPFFRTCLLPSLAVSCPASRYHIASQVATYGKGSPSMGSALNLHTSFLQLMTEMISCVLTLTRVADHLVNSYL
ncbi:hypothetical protein L209DRAFT_752740 [Thermothelomyces heterothallicus CBS 203.75]